MSVAVAKGKPVESANKGLKGVVAADSAVCDIDGNLGKLMYRGYSIHELAENSTFEEVSYLLLQGELPNKTQLQEFSQQLAQQRNLRPQVVQFLKSLDKNVVPMSALRSAVSVAGCFDPEAENESSKAGLVAENQPTALRLIAVMASLVAAIHRIRQGLEPLTSKPELS